MKEDLAIWAGKEMNISFDVSQNSLLYMYFCPQEWQVSSKCQHLPGMSLSNSTFVPTMSMGASYLTDGGPKYFTLSQ